MSVARRPPAGLHLAHEVRLQARRGGGRQRGEVLRAGLGSLANSLSLCVAYVFTLLLV